MAQATYTVPATAVYVDSVSGARQKFNLNAVIPMELAIRFGMPNTTAPTTTTPLPAAQDAWIETRIAAALAAVSAAGSNGLHNPSARTATADGLTTGIVSDVTDFVTVTSGNSAHIITLPTPTPGRKVSLRNAGTGYNLQSSAPATVGINGGVGASAKSAIGANVLTECRCDSGTSWVCTNYSTAGVVSATAVAS